MNNSKTNLTKEFTGYIKKDEPNKVSGKYLVYIPELLGDSTDDIKTLLLPNETNPSMFSRWLDTDTKLPVSAGSYFPLREGMVVSVRFRGTSLESGYISSINSEFPLVDSPDKRDSFYLINKTLNGSWIYQDDSKNLTHIMHNNGSANIIIKNNSISLQIGGEAQKNIIEVSDKSTTMQYGKKSSIIMDDTGIKFKVGDNVISMTESGILLKSLKNLDIEASSKLNLKGDVTKLQGSTTLNVYGNVTRISGAHQLNLTGSVVALDSTFTTAVKSKGVVELNGMTKTKVSGAMLTFTSLGNVSLDGSAVTISSKSTNITGSTLNLSGSSVAIDGTISHGLSIASSVNDGMVSMGTSLDESTEKANMAAVQALAMNDPITSSTHTVMTQTLPGAAEMIGEIQSPVESGIAAGSGIKENVKYILSSNDTYNILVEEQFKNLRNTHDILV